MPNVKHMCGYYILVEVEEVEEKTESGIVLPKEHIDREQSASDVGRVKMIGKSAFGGMEAVKGETAEERAEAWGVKVGDLVEFTRYDGKDHSTFRYIQDQHIIAVLEEDE